MLLLKVPPFVLILYSPWVSIYKMDELMYGVRVWVGHWVSDLLIDRIYSCHEVSSDWQLSCSGDKVTKRNRNCENEGEESNSYFPLQLQSTGTVLSLTNA